MDSNMIPRHEKQPETNRKPPDFVGWADPTRSDQIRYRIDEPGQLTQHLVSNASTQEGASLRIIPNEQVSVTTLLENPPSYTALTTVPGLRSLLDVVHTSVSNLRNQMPQDIVTRLGVITAEAQSNAASNNTTTTLSSQTSPQ
jgi:hypothetical protein